MNELEKFLDSNTPPFVVNVHGLQKRFHIEKWWECPVFYDDGVIKPKSHEDICNGYFGKMEKYPYMPSFILNDGNQMRRLDKAVWNAENGIAYYNPFWREYGWYVVVVDEIVLIPELVETAIKNAYENGGHRVLVLFIQDAREAQLEKLLDFAGIF